jgi:hypothetical protein
MIYVYRTLEPRIAIFGRRMPVSLPLFYNHPDDWVTLNALEENDDIAVLFRARSGDLVAEPLMVPARAVDLIQGLADLPTEDEVGSIRGVGLSYTHVVEVLDALCASGTIPARLVMQTASITDLLGPAELPERLEADEVPLLIDQRQEGEDGTSVPAPDDPNADLQRPE